MSMATGTTFIRGVHKIVWAAAAIAMVLAGLPAAAQSTWLPTTGTVPWTSGTNWSGPVPNAVGAVANFFNGGSGASLIATSVTTGTITMTGTTGNIVIGDTSTTNDIVTLAVASGSPVVNVTNGTPIIFMYANVEGTQGITKNGSGNFSFRFNGAAQNYSGPIAINGGVFTINQDSSLGNADNDITIAGGARLAVSPGGNTGTITLPSTRTITLSSGTGQIGVTHGPVTGVVDGTVSGAGGLSKVDPGNLTINGAVSYQGDTRVTGGVMTFTSGSFTTSTGNVNVSGTAATGLLGASLNLGTLSAFTLNAPTKTVVVQPATTASGTITSDLTLSATTNTLTVASITAGGAAGSSQGNSNLGRLLLGAANVINTGSIGVGGFNARGEISFQPGLPSKAVTIRGVTGGSSEVATVDIGATSSGSRSGGGVVNFTGATVDALFGNVTIGKHIAHSNNDSTSSFSFDAGSVATSGTLLMGLMTGTGNAAITALFTQGGGTSTVREIRFAQDTVATSAPVISATYALNGGSLFAATVTGGTGAMGAATRRTLSINGGTLRNYDASTDLSVNGVDATASGLVNVPIGASGGTIQVDAGRTATFGQFAALGGSGALTKSGAGSLVIDGTGGYAGAIAVNAGSMFVNGGLPSASAVTVASGAVLGGSGTVGGSASLLGGGTLSPGAASSIGTLTLSNLLTLDSATQLNYSLLASDTTPGGGINDLVTGVTNLTLTGVLNVAGSGDWTAVAPGASWRLFDYTGTLTGTSLTLGSMPTLAAGYSFVIDTSTAGQVNLSVVPEPAALVTVGIGGLAAALGMARRRRSGR